MFLDCYHRAFEMIEKRFKSKYDERYQTIKRMIASYLVILVHSPENLEISITRDDIRKEIMKYITETEQDEVDHLMKDLGKYSGADPEGIKFFFIHVLDIIKDQTLNPAPTVN